MNRYAEKTFNAVKRADKHLLGVQLGAACIDAHIPVQIAAKWVGVTRQGLYYWFTGVTDIAERHRTKVEHIVKVLHLALEDEKLPAQDLETAMGIIKTYRRLVK